MLEVKARDAWGRVAQWDVKGKRLLTPYLFPVVNPRKQLLGVEEIERMGFKGIITNSYLIGRDRELRKKALDMGVHRLLNFDSLVMTDSGSFQLSRYGEVETSPQEIMDFQEMIGVDVGVILDIPTPPYSSRERAEEDLEETLKRARESLARKGKGLLAGTVQGSTYGDLREKSSREVARMDFDLHPIGGVVPLMEDYRFSEVVRIIRNSRPFLPHRRPVHLFGAGHPMFFSLAVALGCDLFDSAAYALYAREDRYITPLGTHRLESMRELPCSCEVCTSLTPEELRSMKRKERAYSLARHNLTVSGEEIRRIRQSIYRGSLWELVSNRARAHPYLLDALRTALNSPGLKKMEPVTKKSAFLYTGSESLSRPEVREHLKRLERLKVEKKLVLLPEVEKPFSRSYGLNSTEEYHPCVVSSVFGIIPLELEEIYPLSQHEGPSSPEEAQVSFMRETAKRYASKFKKVYYHRGLEYLEIEGEAFSSLWDFYGGADMEGKLRAMGDYHFGRGAGKLLFSSRISPRISPTGRIREVYSGYNLVAVIRASDGAMVLHREGARRLLGMPFPKNRVVAGEDAIEFLERGRNLFCGFVEEADRGIKPYQEVVVVDKRDKAVATGRAMVSGEEMLDLERGIGVKVRHGLG